MSKHLPRFYTNTYCLRIDEGTRGGVGGGRRRRRRRGGQWRGWEEKRAGGRTGNKGEEVKRANMIGSESASLEP